MDVLGGFLDDRCILNAQAHAAAGDLYKQYAGWCETVGEKPTAQRGFGSALRERGFESRKGVGGRKFWHGIGLLSECAESDHSDHEDRNTGYFNYAPTREEKPGLRSQWSEWSANAEFEEGQI